MRIGIASYFYPRGGSAYAIRSIVDGLVRRGLPYNSLRDRWAALQKKKTPQSSMANFLHANMTIHRRTANGSKASTQWLDQCQCMGRMSRKGWRS